MNLVSKYKLKFALSTLLLLELLFHPQLYGNSLSRINLFKNQQSLQGYAYSGFAHSAMSSSGKQMIVWSDKGFKISKHFGKKRSWQQINDANIASAAIAKNGKYIAYADVNANFYISHNYGEDWEHYSAPAVGVSTAMVIADNGTIILNANDDGNYISKDLGQTWHQLSVGGRTEISDDASKLITVSHHKAYLSLNGGAKFAPLSINKAFFEVTAAAMSAKGDKMLILGEKSVLEKSVHTIKLYASISQDQGKTWSAPVDIAKASRQSVIPPVFPLAISHSADLRNIAIVVESTFPDAVTNQTYPSAIYTSDVYLSRNYGKTWVSPHNINDLLGRAVNTVTVSSQGRYLLVTSATGQVFISANNGRTWLYPAWLNGYIIYADQAILSATGQYMLITTEMDNKNRYPAPSLSANVFTSTSHGYRWKNIFHVAGKANPLLFKKPGILH